MDKCPNCGCPTGCHTVGVAALWQPEIDGTHFDCMTIAWEDGQVDVGMDCLRRQLAAANERAVGYKEALADIKTNHQHAEYVYDRATMALEVPDAL